MNHVINQALIDEIQPHYTDTPLAIFLIGANGSGKSTLRKYLNLSDIQTNIDPDVLNRIFKTRYPENYLIESARQALNMYNEGIKSRLNICIESTLSGCGTTNRIKLAKDSGYHVIGYFVGLTNVDLNLERIRNRVTHGGHNIPEIMVRRRYIESTHNLVQVQNLFNELHLIDNSGEAYNMQISKYGNRVIQHTANLEQWAQNLII